MPDGQVDSFHVSPCKSGGGQRSGSFVGNDGDEQNSVCYKGNIYLPYRVLFISLEKNYFIKFSFNKVNF